MKATGSEQTSAKKFPEPNSPELPKEGKPASRGEKQQFPARPGEAAGKKATGSY